MDTLTIKENKKCQFIGMPKDGREEQASKIKEKFVNELIEARKTSKCVEKVIIIPVGREAEEFYKKNNG